MNYAREMGREIIVERHGAGMEDRSVRSCHAVCQMALDRAVKDGLIRTNPAVGTILLPPAIVELLAEYKAQLFSEWMFPSRVKPEQPIDPGYVRERLQVILERAGCKKVRFHDLRYTFATMSLENGMDVKPLSTIIGHVSSLNICTHITGEMQCAARNIDQGIAGIEAQEQDKAGTGGVESGTVGGDVLQILRRHIQR